MGNRSPIGDGHGEWIVPGDPAAEPNFVSGKFAKAVQLTGGGKLIRIRHYPQLKPREQITISAWIKPAQYDDQWRQIYRKEDGNARQLLALGRTGDTRGIWVGLGIGGAYKEYGAPVPTNELMDGKWHFVAAAYDGAFQRIYLDGKEIAKHEASGQIDTGGAVSAYIGSSDGNQEFFSGGIDDVRVYSRALSPLEIEAMAGKNVGNDRALVGWWTLDGDLKNTAAGNDGSPPLAPVDE